MSPKLIQQQKNYQSLKSQWLAHTGPVNQHGFTSEARKGDLAVKFINFLDVIHKHQAS